MSQSRKVESVAHRFAEGEQGPQPNNGRDERGRFAVGNGGGEQRPGERCASEQPRPCATRVESHTPPVWNAVSSSDYTALLVARRRHTTYVNCARVIS